MMRELWTLGREYDRALLMSLERSPVRRALAGEFLKRIWQEKDTLREAYKRLNFLESELRTQYAQELNGTPAYDTKVVDNGSRLDVKAV